uniref:NADH-ubiquinone oxidoreductase chain 6 n=1 Tax=Silvanus unidentatus TaxID=295940 RepID=S4SV02_SILUN|nr:NADH dehydrogenase subunit 6 [Silvanus unidentatus]
MLTSLMILPALIPLISHPVSAGILILMQTLLIAINTNVKYSNSWYSYILFMIMIGGLMVLFMYMTSVASNEKFKFSFKITLIFMLLLMINIAPTWQKITPINQSDQNFSLSITKYLSWPYSMMFIIVIIYLLITLVASIKIMEIKSGPLRQKF